MIVSIYTHQVRDDHSGVGQDDHFRGAVHSRHCQEMDNVTRPYSCSCRDDSSSVFRNVYCIDRLWALTHPLILSCVLLAACGGGGSSSPDRGDVEQGGSTDAPDEGGSAGQNTDTPPAPEGDLPGGPFFTAENSSALLSGEVRELPSEALDQDFRRSIPFQELRSKGEP